MDDDLRKILGEEPATTPPEETQDETAAEAPAEPEISAEEQEVKTKAEQLANLNKAIAEAQGVLKKSRKEIKAARVPVEEEEIPKINLEDPSAKAWDRHIRESSAPLHAEIEQAKSERRSFALRQFLGDHPALAKDKEKLESLMGTYEKLRTASELTTEGILIDLEKAYAAEHADELLSAARQYRIDSSRSEEAYSDIAVSRGATTYSNPKASTPHYTEDELEIMRGWDRAGAPKVK